MKAVAVRAALAVVLASWGGGAFADEEGRKLFTSVTPACALCHKLRDAGTQGEVGPPLDEIKPDAARVVKALKNGIGQMPPYPHLTDAQIQALARYVEQATR